MKRLLDLCCSLRYSLGQRKRTHFAKLDKLSRNGFHVGAELALDQVQNGYGWCHNAIWRPTEAKFVFQFL